MLGVLDFYECIKIIDLTLQQKNGNTWILRIFIIKFYIFENKTLSMNLMDGFWMGLLCISLSHICPSSAQEEEKGLHICFSVLKIRTSKQLQKIKTVDLYKYLLQINQFTVSFSNVLLIKLYAPVLKQSLLAKYCLAEFANWITNNWKIFDGFSRAANLKNLKFQQIFSVKSKVNFIHMFDALF
jgi:hypothetical protein